MVGICAALGASGEVWRVGGRRLRMCGCGDTGSARGSMWRAGVGRAFCLSFAVLTAKCRIFPVALTVISVALTEKTVSRLGFPVSRPVFSVT